MKVLAFILGLGLAAIGHAGGGYTLTPISRVAYTVTTHTATSVSFAPLSFQAGVALNTPITIHLANIGSNAGIYFAFSSTTFTPSSMAGFQAINTLPVEFTPFSRNKANFHMQASGTASATVNVQFFRCDPFPF